MKIKTDQDGEWPMDLVLVSSSPTAQLQFWSQKSLQLGCFKRRGLSLSSALDSDSKPALSDCQVKGYEVNRCSLAWHGLANHGDAASQWDLSRTLLQPRSLVQLCPGHSAPRTWAMSTAKQNRIDGQRVDHALTKWLSLLNSIYEENFENCGIRL